METQAVSDLIARAVGDEVRGELARRRRSVADFATAIGVTPHTAGRRLNGAPPFNLVELGLAASFLGTTVTALVSAATARLAREGRSPADPVASNTSSTLTEVAS